MRCEVSRRDRVDVNASAASPTAGERFTVEVQRYPASVIGRWFWAALEVVTVPLTFGAGLAMDRIGVTVIVRYRSTGQSAAHVRYPASKMGAAQHHFESLTSRLRSESAAEFAVDLGIE